MQIRLWHVGMLLMVPALVCWAGRAIANDQTWPNNSDASWEEGLNAAEMLANLLESAQLVPLSELPTRQVGMLRRGKEDRQALRTLLEKDIVALQPYAR
jgi:hypothetical protein